MNIIFVIGPPGAGKSIFVTQNTYLKGNHVKLIDPDQMKKTPGEQDHEESIEKAKKAYLEALRDTSTQVIVYQGSGSWYPYMRWLFDQARSVEINPMNIKMSLVFVHADLSICLERASKRKEQTGQEVALTVVKKRHEQVWNTLSYLRQDPRISEFAQINTNGHTPKIEVVETKSMGIPRAMSEVRVVQLEET